MRFRTKIIILAIITVLITSTFYPAWRTYAAEASQDSPAIHLTGAWVNPYYVDNYTKSASAESLQPMGVLIPYSVPSFGNMAELKPFLYQAFTNRETNIQVTYTGELSDLGELNGEGNLINTTGLVSLTNSIIAEDDYLRFNIKTDRIPFNLNGTTGNILINFTPTYLTTLAQETYVDGQVTAILSAIIDPGMNPHQIVKAIHDYIVLNVAYDTTLTEHSAYAALYGDKKTVCQGYALLAYKMLEEAGLQARIISGNAGGPHAWNMVEIESQWYYMDCTWDDPVPDEAGRVIYTYYNLSNAEISANHTPDPEYTDLPPANTTYLAALNTLIAAEPNNEIYPRLRQQLGLDYLLPENTAEDASALESKWLAAAEQEISPFKVRYNNSSDDLSSALLNEIFYRIAAQTELNGYGLEYADFNRGGTTGYLLLDFAFTYTATNQAPTAGSVAITGLHYPGKTMTGTYSYTDLETDPEGLSKYQWYRGNSTDASSKTIIPGAIGRNYKVQSIDASKYLFFAVQPVASAGTLSGSSVVSSASSQIASLQSIAITVPAKLNYYVGDPLNISQLVVTGTYSDSSTNIESITAENISGFNSTAAAAAQTLTITVGGQTAAYTIKIEEKPVDECFIATAAFGSKFTWPVALLRHFRDQYLLTNDIGTAFVNFYYRNSPPIAAFIAQSEPLKMLVRALLAPVIAIVYIIYHPTLMVTALGLLIVLLAYRFRQKRRYV